MKWKLVKKRGCQSAANFRKSVSVEEKKWRAAMARLEKLQSFQQGQLGRAALFPFFRNRCVSF